MFTFQSITSVYNAVLTGQRVLFVGYNHAAGDVCKIVLAACALVSPPVEVGRVEHFFCRVFVFRLVERFDAMISPDAGPFNLSDIRFEVLA